MKKYIRNILLISLVISSSICFSQDWSGDSRIRVENYQTENEEGNAIQKMKEKKMDLIVLNSLRDQNSGFNYDTNKIEI